LEVSGNYQNTLDYYSSDCLVDYMKTFRVAICLEEGVVITIKANNEEEALKKAKEVGDEFGGSDYPEEYQGKHVHRDYFTQDATEMK